MESVRQAHYAGGDALHQRQGELAEAALEVSRLEERIRYVVEGRERAQARLAELKAQNEQWAERQAEAQAELERIAAADAWPPRNSRSCRPRRPRSRRSELPGAGRRGARGAAAQQPAAQRGGRGAAADPGAGGRKPQRRRPVAPAAAAPRAARQRTPGPGAPDLQQAGRSCSATGAALTKARRWPRRGCTSWASRCRRWTNSAAPGAGGRNRSRAPGRAGRAAGGAARAAGQGAERAASSSPG